MDYANGRVQPEGKSNVQNSASLNVVNPVFTDIFYISVNIYIIAGFINGADQGQ